MSEPEKLDDVLEESESVQEQLSVYSQNDEDEPEVILGDIYVDKCELGLFSGEPTRGNIVGRIDDNKSVPKLVFIVPYRNREAHYKVFSSTMKTVLEKTNIPYKIFYVHQTDDRSFNRGAMKNIGFLVVKSLYPADYADITLVFNDIDTMPTSGTVLDYETQHGNIKHFYGFDYTLGGIVSIKAIDFERLNGFPNFWAWGYEDNLLQTRAKTKGMRIDRDVFYKIFDPRIIHLVDSPIREVNREEYDRFLNNTTEGIDSITNLNYKINDETGFVDVFQFDTRINENIEKRADYDLRNGPAPFKDLIMKRRRNPTMVMRF